MITYYVEIRANGGGATFHWPEGTWFQASPFIGREYASQDKAREAVERYRDDRGQYAYLPMRIVMYQVTETVVEEIA